MFALQHARTFALVLFFGLACEGSQAMAQTALTGAGQFSTDPSGTFSGGQYWNTLASGSSSFNIYLTAANSGIGGAFVNSGNLDATTRINIPLTPGVYTFHYFGQPGTDVGAFGLNLFFNGNDASPGISVFAPTDQPPSPPYPGFLANASATTPQLDHAFSTAGSGTLFFSDGTHQVSLIDYRWSNPLVEGLDRVQGFNNVPDGLNDFVGHFTLVVNTVPEPGSVALICAAVLGGAGWLWRRRRIAHDKSALARRRR